MEDVLCDELIQEIFYKLPPSSSCSVSRVSKRWLHLYRSSRTSLSLKLINNEISSIPSLSSLLSHHPSLTFISLLSSSHPTTAPFSDHLLSVVSSSCPLLRGLRYLAGPVFPSSLISLSKSSTHLTSLSINLSRPINLKWVSSFHFLKELSLSLCSEDEKTDLNKDYEMWEEEDYGSELGLENLSLSGIKVEDLGFGWLWRSCKKLKKLRLYNCQGIGDGGSYSSFLNCLKGLEEVELRTCRSIVDGVLLRLSQNCESLNSLLIYDGGSREALLHFFLNCRSNLEKLDLRLPLDLNNSHLSANAVNFRGLSSLRLQSCCLVTGEGLKALGMAINYGLQELALINCDVVERETGLLATLGQNLKQLRKLDLSHNEMLLDKEVVSMLVSCNELTDLRLRGCKGLTNAAMFAILRSCKCVECIDIVQCCGIEKEAVEMFMKDSPRLRRVEVEETKLSDAARMWASHKFLEVVV